MRKSSKIDLKYSKDGKKIINITLRESNKSKTILTGSIWKTCKCGDVKVLGQVDKAYVYKGKYKSFNWFLVSFTDGTEAVVSSGALAGGAIKNPFKPSLYNVGFNGRGEYSAITHKKEYALWTRILERCYSDWRKEHSPTYHDVIVDEWWHCFQNFAKDINHLEGYSNWGDGQKEKRNPYEIDKDILSGARKIYSKDTCMFVSHNTNMASENKTQHSTHKCYIGHRLIDKYEEEFTNIRKFSLSWTLLPTCVNAILIGETPSTQHKGWTFWEKDVELPVKIQERVAQGKPPNRSNITGFTYIATRTTDNYIEEFTIQTAFASKYNLNVKAVNACVNGRRKVTEGWTFQIKE